MWEFQLTQVRVTEGCLRNQKTSLQEEEVLVRGKERDGYWQEAIHNPV